MLKWIFWRSIDVFILLVLLQIAANLSNVHYIFSECFTSVNEEHRDFYCSKTYITRKVLLYCLKACKESGQNLLIGVNWVVTVGGKVAKMIDNGINSL
jgi:hypothetical protein